MNDVSPNEGRRIQPPAVVNRWLMNRQFGWQRPALACLVILTGLSIYILNGASLFYFDTAGYLKQGYAMLQSLGLSGEGAAAISETAAKDTIPDHTVIGSRSAAYGLVIAVLDRFGLLDGGVLLNLAVVWLSASIFARQLARQSNCSGRVFDIAAAGMIAASLGALPFYIAFLMPDLLAPVLILLLATLCTSAQHMGRMDLLLSICLVLVAVVTHLSHLMMAALILPFGILVAPAMAGRRLWLAAGLAILLLGVGVTERLAFSVIVDRVQQKETLYLPFLTARLIEDGPGLKYLEARCPDPGIATCVLLDALSHSDDPDRFNAPNILFATSPSLGSFRVLSEGDQQRVADEQFHFFVDVARGAPLTTFGAFAKNVAIQIAYFRVDMTVPPKGQLELLQLEYGQAISNLREGRLIVADRSWMDPIAIFHTALYVVCTISLAVLLLSRKLPHQTRLMVVIVVYGLFINALVCGGVSEPAYRYGGRVIFLIPMVLVMLLAVRKFSIHHGDVSSVSIAPQM